MRRTAALATVAVGLAAFAPSPGAEAQTVITVCVANQSGAVLRSRFTYKDWQGASHTTAWTTTALGQRLCNRLQDIGSLTIAVQANDVIWRDVCTRSYSGADALRSRTLFVTGTLFNISCHVEG